MAAEKLFLGRSRTGKAGREVVSMLDRASLDAESKVDEHPQTHREEVRLWLRLLTCATLVETEIRRRLREEFDMTLPRFDLLAQLERSTEGLLLSEVSRRLMVSNGNVTGLVERLVQEGFVRRVTDRDDRRAARVSLTKSGRAAFTHMAEAHGGWLADMLGGLGSDRRKALLAALGELKGVVRQATGKDGAVKP